MCAFPIVGALHGCRGAQTVPEPVVNGHPPQPSQQLIDGRERARTRARDRSVQLEIDRLHDELLRVILAGRTPAAAEATRRRRNPMNWFRSKAASVTDAGNTVEYGVARDMMTPLINALIKLGILKADLDYHLMRAAMVIIFFFFGYQKWWAYEAQRLIPYISNGPLIFWLYPAFGMRGATWFLASRNGRSARYCS
jgi:hypothetical protein